jgi:hypothetical protein
MKRNQIINFLIEKMGYESYLEIGTQNPKNNFNLIRAQNKVCVEPRPIPNTKHLISFIGTSDQYFGSISEDVKFDIIFIDGLHQDDQVTRDINNSLKHLNENGTIVCHDCLPNKEELQYHEPHNDPKRSWFGTTWKSIARLRIESTNLDIKTVDSDAGCAIIRFGQNIPYCGPDGDPYTYSYYEKNKNDLMNVISIKEFVSYIDPK